MIKRMRTLFFLLFPVIFMSACGSGASSSNAGGAGTNTGTTNLILFGSVTPTFTSSDTGACPIPKTVTTDSVTLNITLQDQSVGLTALPNQGVTFDSYRLVYNPINQGIPIPLTPKTRALTTPVSLGNAQTVTQGVAIVLVDLETKAEYISRDSGSINTYNVNITYRGRDFITNQPVTLVVDTQMEMGAFCTTEDLEPEPEEPAPEEPEEP
jgi:hypothetical protein